MFLVLFFVNLSFGSLITFSFLQNHLWATALYQILQLTLASFFAWAWNRAGTTHPGTNPPAAKLPVLLQPSFVLVVVSLFSNVALLTFDIASARLH